MKAIRTYAAAAAVVLAGCATAPPTATFKGAQVPTVSGITVTCTSPYVFTQHCSPGGGGASLKLLINNVPMRVAGTADGRSIVVMSEAAIPTQQRAEEAVEAMGAAAEPTGARLVKMEAIALVGVGVLGYIIHFDRDVYSGLRRFTNPS